MRKGGKICSFFWQGVAARNGVQTAAAQIAGTPDEEQAAINLHVSDRAHPRQLLLSAAIDFQFRHAHLLAFLTWAVGFERLDAHIAG